MSMVSPHSPVSAAPHAMPPAPVWRLSVAQYHEMIRTHILQDGDPVELLEGWLILKISKNPPHRIATRLTVAALQAITPTGWYVDSQEPITTANSEPEPDVAIIRGDTRQYADRHPGPQDVVLVVEVADDSLERDRTIKKRVYAAAGVLVYWIVNLPERRVEVYTNPSGPSANPDYASSHDYAETDAAPLYIDGLEVGHIVVRELLP